MTVPSAEAEETKVLGFICETVAVLFSCDCYIPVSCMRRLGYY